MSHSCLYVRLARGRFLLGHIEDPIAARLFPLRCDVHVEMYSRLRYPPHVRIIKNIIKPNTILYVLTCNLIMMFPPYPTPLSKLVH